MVAGSGRDFEYRRANFIGLAPGLEGDVLAAGQEKALALPERDVGAVLLSFVIASSLLLAARLSSRPDRHSHPSRCALGVGIAEIAYLPARREFELEAAIFVFSRGGAGGRPVT